MNFRLLATLIEDGNMSRRALCDLLDFRGECEGLDYKERFHLDSAHDLGSCARDIAAFKNVGGGFIVVGVKDKTWDPIGLPAPLTLGNKTLDTKLLREKLRKVTGLDIEVDVVHHELPVNRHFAVLFVRGKKRRAPVLLNADFWPNESYGFRRGEIYARRGDSTIRISKQEEFEQLLETLEERAAYLAITPQRSPFAIEDGTYRLLDKGFEYFVGRETIREELLSAIRGDPRIWIVNVHGPGGVGKSALVNWAVYELYATREFESIIQLSAKKTSLTQQGVIDLGSRTLVSLENLFYHIFRAFDEEIPPDLESQRRLAIELLCAWRTLLVLDNMEDVEDARILEFCQKLPPEQRSRIVITSRDRSSGWEQPLPLTELNRTEIRAFVDAKVLELDLKLALNDKRLEQIQQATGGLPLAIEWLLGRFRVTTDFETALADVVRDDSPLLQFSFDHSWRLLGADARALLVLMAEFNGPPTREEIMLASRWDADRVSAAVAQLTLSTLLNPVSYPTEGATRFAVLPITLAFARTKADEIAGFLDDCRRRLRELDTQANVEGAEARQFASLFARFGFTSQNDRRAAILCRRAQSEAGLGKPERAALLFDQAKQLAPANAYVLATFAAHELAFRRQESAYALATEACRCANRRTGSTAYAVLAQIHDARRNREAQIEALRKALDFDSSDSVLRHQLGVALSRASKTPQAIAEFTTIIDAEEKRPVPTPTLVMALTTRALNFRRLDRMEESRRDVRRAKALVEREPSLASCAWSIRRLEGE